MISRLAMAVAALTVSISGAVAQSPPPDPDYFVGRWGKVAFNDDRDLGRMINMARSFCGNIPYMIRRRSGDAFEMFVAETLRDVRVVSDGSRLFIVPVGADATTAGVRELSVRDRNVFTLRYLDQQNHSRYGANVFVRCGAANREARPRPQQNGAAGASQGPETVGTIRQ